MTERRYFLTRFGAAAAAVGLGASHANAQTDALVKRGVHFAVYDMGTHRFAGVIARKVDGNADAIYKEMTGNLVGNAHFVAAGIIAVNRAQQRGYSVSYAG